MILIILCQKIYETNKEITLVNLCIHKIYLIDKQWIFKIKIKFLSLKSKVTDWVELFEFLDNQLNTCIIWIVWYLNY